MIGTEPYRFIARDYGKPVVVAGFEPLDVLQGVYMILDSSARDAPRSRTSTAGWCREEGNPLALEAIAETMELRTTFEWRGLGSSPRAR